MENGGCTADKTMEKKESVLDLFIQKTSRVMREISDELSISPELESAINEENISEIR